MSQEKFRVALLVVIVICVGMFSYAIGRTKPKSPSPYQWVKTGSEWYGTFDPNTGAFFSTSTKIAKRWWTVPEQPQHQSITTSDELIENGEP
jgi:hypothetical protein